MPLCQPSVVASSKHQWVTIKQDSHLSLQECKIVGKSWWSSGEVTWAYRVVLTATDTQLAYASDITQIVTDWEFVQKLVSEVPLLDPEASPAANAEMIARVFQRRWDARQTQPQPQPPQPPQQQQQQQPSPSQERDNISIEITNCSSSSSSSGGSGGSGEQQQQKPSFEKRSGSRIFFRTPIGTPTSIKRLMLGAEATPFPGIPLHREGQPAPVTPRRSSEIAPSSAEQAGDSNPRPTAAVDSGAAAAAHMVQERELQGKLERSLDAVEKAVTAPAGLQQDQHYRIYADCINGLLHELRAVKNGAGVTTAVAGAAAHSEATSSTSSSTSTAELLCLLSRASLDAARVLVASQKQQLDQQQNQQHKEGSSQETEAVVTPEAVAPSSSAALPPMASTTEAVSGDEDLHKAKEGQGDDAEPGSGDTEKAMPPVSATGVESNSSDTHLGSAGERETSPKVGETNVDAVKRLQRCLELFAAASKCLSSMAEHNGSVTTD